MASVSDAPKEDSISDEELGYMITPLPDFMILARDIQNRGDCRMGTNQMEARHFREFFGTSVVVVEKVWTLLERDSLLPEKCDPKHLLWALHFMKVYPKQSSGCSSVGASDGAVDPKTHKKWVWAFIEAIAELVDVVVSQMWLRLYYYYNYCILTHPLNLR